MTARTVRIAVDAMGGDLGPEEAVRGMITAHMEAAGRLALTAVGDEAVIRRELSRHRHAQEGVCVHHASQTIEMADKPREVYRKKPDASVVVAARLVRDGHADAFISVGNTGAAMASAIFMLRPLAGIDRPAIATPLPSLKGHIVLLDAGANVDCKPRHLLDFALMGQVYARYFLGKPSPSVGLLSNGSEDTKGNELTRLAHPLLKARVTNFRGNIEGMDVFRGDVDVIVCDGFDGNIVLKVGEGVAEMVLQMVRQELTRHRWKKLLLLPFRHAIHDLRNRIDYREFGGAPLMGVNGICVIGHGRSDARAIANAIRVAETAIRSNLVQEIQQAVAPTAVAEGG